MPYKDNETRRAVYRANADRFNRTKERYRYGICRDDMIELLGNDDCAICGFNGGLKRNAIDHCKEINQARGFLCGPCNQAIGLLNHCPHRLRKAAEYMERPPLIAPERYAHLLRVARGKQTT